MKANSPQHPLKYFARTKSPHLPSASTLMKMAESDGKKIKSNKEMHVHHINESSNHPLNKKILLQNKQIDSLRKQEKIEKIEKSLPSIKISAEQRQKSEDETTEQGSDQHIQYINNQYQLGDPLIFNKKKNVKFTDRVALLQKEIVQKLPKQNRNSSILKNSSRVLDASIVTETDRSYSIQNSFTATRKSKLGFNFQQNHANNLIKQKYKTLLNELEQKHEQKMLNSKNIINYKINGDSTSNQISYDKYTDQLFPPVQSSIYNSSTHKKNTFKIKEEMSWIRISQLYSQKKLQIFTKNNDLEHLAIVKNDRSYCENYLVCAFNAIKNNKNLLNHIFEDTQINPFGIYLLKIYKENAWKYVIIDDMIPVIKYKIKSKKQRQENKYQCAFLEVINFSEADETLSIWPFLLQKAYASYYSCYENLHFGNPVDFLTELIGVSEEKIYLGKKNSSEELESKQKILFEILKHENTIALGWSDDDLPYVPMCFQQKISLTQDSTVTYYDPLSQYQAMKIDFSSLPTLFNYVIIYRYKKYAHATLCCIYPPKTLPKSSKVEKKNNESAKKQEQLPYVETSLSETTSVRTFTLLKSSESCLAIRQKQNRFYYQCGIKQYMWVRAILLQRQYDGGYRWIRSQYTNQKSIVFHHLLEAGQYYLIVMVEWREKHNRQLSVILESDNQFIKLERKIFKAEDNLLELGCMDLAQRHGKLNQISRHICSYTYLCEESAIIIENINNQRTKGGEVTIMRSIHGLKARVQIIPMNKQFQLDTIDQYTTDKIHTIQDKRKINKSIQIDIPMGQSYTVILRMKGGIDKKFIKAFNFG